MKKHLTITNFFIFAVLNAMLVIAILLGVKLFANSKITHRLKADYFKVNQLKYGLLDAHNWTTQVNNILNDKICSFTLESKDEKVLKEQLNGVLNTLFDEVDHVLHKKQDKAKDKIKFKVINTFFDIDHFRKEIPKFSSSIIQEINKTKNRDKVKDLLQDKVTNLLVSVSDSIINEKDEVLLCYKCSSIDEFNEKLKLTDDQIEEQQHNDGYYLIFILISVLTLWLILLKIKVLYTTAFLYSVLISFVTLFIGINLPMIEIDARIGQLNLNVLDAHIIFNDQVIFFQSKSILDVIRILISNTKIDSVFVGCLIFVFSVLFPVSKLICSVLYLYFKERSNTFIKYMAFKSGKWSMADVMVVAIFMAYIGFQGILNSQLEKIQTNTAAVNLLTTNKSSLQIGFIVFVSFVLFNLLLSLVLKKITHKSDEDYSLKNFKMYRNFFIKNSDKNL